MRVQETNLQNKILFKSIQLNNQEYTQSNKIIEKMKTHPKRIDTLKGQLYTEIFQKHIEQEAHKKAGKIYYQDDLLQEMCLYFFELFKDIQNATVENIVETLNKFKPNNDTLIENKRFDTISLNQNNNNSLTLEKRISEDNRPIYASGLSNQEKNAINIKLEKAQKTSDLTPKENIVLTKVKEGKTLTQISEELHNCIYLIRNKYLSAIAKIQNSQNSLPPIFSTYTDILTAKYKLEKKLSDQLFQILIKNPQLTKTNINKIINNIHQIATSLQTVTPKKLFVSMFKKPNLFYFKPDTIINNITQLAEKLDIPVKVLTKAVLKQPTIICQKPDTIMNNITQLAEKLNIPIKKITLTALKQPQLFYQKPDTLIKNITELAKKLNITLDKMIKLSLEQPQLFYQKPDTLIKNITELAKITNTPIDIMIGASIHKPSLFSLKPKIIKNNITKIASLLNIDEKLYINMALKHRTLFYITPAIIQKNITTLSQNFNLTKEKIIELSIKQPQMIYNSSTTIINNINELATCLETEDGIKGILKLAIRQPSLFFRNPQSIKENIIKLANTLDVDIKSIMKIFYQQPSVLCLNTDTITNNLNRLSELLDVDKNKLIKASVNNSSILYFVPEKINANITKISEKLNIDKKTIIEAALKQPSAFISKPEKIIKKLNIKNYYKLIRNKIDNKIAITMDSEETLYKKILIYLIQKDDNLKKLITIKDLNAYLSKQNKIYEFKLPEHELKKEFIKFIEEYSMRTFKKQKFKFI